MTFKKDVLKAVSNKMNQLKAEYGESWVCLDDDHPDIIELRNLGIMLGGKEHKVSGSKMPRWTNDEVNYLKNNYLKRTDQEIANDLGFSLDRVKKKRRILGLDKRIEEDLIGVPKVIKYDLNGKMISEYESLRQAAEYNQLDLRKLTKICSGYHPVYGGFVWKYKEEEEE